MIVFIIESLSAEYLNFYSNQKSYAPFLDELIKKSFVVKDFYANGRTSIEAVPTILGGIPSVIGEPYVTSIYQSNRLNGLARVLDGQGYQTHFFHGGQNGTMFRDSAAFITGFKHYYGKNEYPKDQAAHFDGTWGIWDHHFLDFMHEKLNHITEPFLASLFTINPHQPYDIPPEFRNQFEGGPLEILKPLQYIDASLRAFFEKAQREPWYKNTLFVFTADHTSKNLHPEFSHITGRLRVPFFAFHPQVPSWPESKKLDSRWICLIPFWIF